MFATIVFGIFAVKPRTSPARHRPLAVRSEAPLTLMGAGEGGQVEVDLSVLICQALSHRLVGASRGGAAVCWKSALSHKDARSRLSPLSVQTRDSVDLTLSRQIRSKTTQWQRRRCTSVEWVCSHRSFYSHFHVNILRSHDVHHFVCLCSF